MHMTAAELAARCGVTAQTVRDWVRAGLPGRRRGKVFTFEQNTADAWVRANYDADRRNGGKREGAGRKKAAKRSGRESAKKATAQSTGKSTAKAAETAPPDTTPIPTTLDEIERLARAGTLTAAGIDRAREAAALRRQLREEALADGRLLSAADVEQTWGRALTDLRSAIERFAERATALAVTRGVGPAAPLRAALHESCLDLLRALSDDDPGRPPLAPPADPAPAAPPGAQRQ